MSTEVERLEILANAIEKYGFPHGLTEFSPVPAANLLRDASERLAAQADLLRRVTPYLRDVQDEGPVPEGWQSDDLVSLQQEIKKVLL